MAAVLMAAVVMAAVLMAAVRVGVPLYAASAVLFRGACLSNVVVCPRPGRGGTGSTWRTGGGASHGGSGPGPQDRGKDGERWVLVSENGAVSPLLSYQISVPEVA
jgi:uncharacterized membrane protein YgcG